MSRWRWNAKRPTRSFRAGYWVENLGWSLHDRKAHITRKGLIEMLDKSLEEEQASEGWMNVGRVKRELRILRRPAVRRNEAPTLDRRSDFINFTNDYVKHQHLA
jgi:hypothetical protein